MDKQEIIETIHIREKFRDAFIDAIAHAKNNDALEFAKHEREVIDNELKYLYNCLYELEKTEELENEHS